MPPVRYRLRIDELQSAVAPLVEYGQQGIVHYRESRQRGELDRRRHQSWHRCVVQSDPGVSPVSTFLTQGYIY